MVIVITEGAPPEIQGKTFMGVKGVHPLGCLPLWGREGVTLITHLMQKGNN